MEDRVLRERPGPLTQRPMPSAEAMTSLSHPFTQLFSSSIVIFCHWNMAAHVFTLWPLRIGLGVEHCSGLVRDHLNSTVQYSVTQATCVLKSFHVQKGVVFVQFFWCTVYSSVVMFYTVLYCYAVGTLLFRSMLCSKVKQFCRGLT